MQSWWEYVLYPTALATFAAFVQWAARGVIRLFPQAWRWRLARKVSPWTTMAVGIGIIAALFFIGQLLGLN